MDYPFIFGSATFGEWFTDREADSRRLATNFQHGVNTILISPRRWGKTSLVHKVSQNTTSSRLCIVNMDIFSCRNEEVFYAMFATEVIKQSASKWEEWAENAKRFLSALIPKISFGIDPVTDFSLSLDFSNPQHNEEVLHLPEKIATEKGIKIVICIDEFQQIGEFENALNFQRKLRSVWQLQQKVSYCLYGSKQHLMAKMFSKQSMPFYKFGDVVYLQKIAASDWIPFIQERFAATDKEIDEALARRICEAVENHSSYVQQLAWLVWVQTDKKATESNFETAYNDLLSQNSMLYSNYTENLTAYQLNFLNAVANGVTSEFTKKSILQKYQLGTVGNIGRLKKSLENKELIDISGKNDAFNDPVFKEWFRKNIKRFS